MIEIGIRALKQNASGVVADAAAGEDIVITDRGRPVARMTALPTSRLAFLIDSGLARPPRRNVVELDAPEAEGDLSATLADLRGGERF